MIKVCKGIETNNEGEDLEFLTIRLKIQVKPKNIA